MKLLVSISAPLLHWVTDQTCLEVLTWELGHQPMSNSGSTRVICKPRQVCVGQSMDKINCFSLNRRQARNNESSFNLLGKEIASERN